jgi:hypothetical protein
MSLHANDMNYTERITIPYISNREHQVTTYHVPRTEQVFSFIIFSQRKLIFSVFKPQFLLCLIINEYRNVHIVGLLAINRHILIMT